MNVNQVAFCTVTTLAVATAGSAILAATTAATAAIVAYSIFAVIGAGVSIASITAWIKVKSDPVNDQTVGNYFQTIPSHAGYALAGMAQFIAQTLVHALVSGVADGIGRKISRMIGGPDVTIGRA